MVPSPKPRSSEPGVAHEDRRGVEVVAQKGEAGSEQRDGQRGCVEAAGEHGEREHGKRRDARNAGGQAVQTIDEVDDVREGHEIDDGDGVGDEAELDIGARGERIDHAADEQAAGGGDAGGEDLSEEFAARAERVHVVDGAVITITRKDRPRIG